MLNIAVWSVKYYNNIIILKYRDAVDTARAPQHGATARASAAGLRVPALGHPLPCVQPSLPRPRACRPAQSSCSVAVLSRPWACAARAGAGRTCSAGPSVRPPRCQDTGGVQHASILALRVCSVYGQSAVRTRKLWERSPGQDALFGVRVPRLVVAGYLDGEVWP